MLIIELPEGGWVDAESIVAVVPVPPESEFSTEEVAGSAILLASGHSVATEETPERVLQQIAELVAAAAGLGGDDDGE